MRIVSPQTVEELERRNALLQASLRPEPLPFPVADEYPIVLSPRHRDLSHCLMIDKNLAAHANLWPRVLNSPARDVSHAVGLVGNVATAAEWRGKGHMRQLFAHLENSAHALGLEALILWSDLHQFYQTLGFASLGREWRFFFDIEELHRGLASCEDTFLVDAQSLSDEELEALLALRHPTRATLRRSAEEFRELLKIPATGLFVRVGANGLEGYAVLGKGYDMMGVIHEWGAPDPLSLAATIGAIGQHLDARQLILLAPGSLAQDWQAELVRLAVTAEEHPMALAKPLAGDRESLEATLAETFIWGLDSI